MAARFPLRREAIALSETQDIEELFEVAEEITRHFGKPDFNPCSIINARPGKCSIERSFNAKEIGFELCSGGIIGMGEIVNNALSLQSCSVK